MIWRRIFWPSSAGRPADVGVGRAWEEQAESPPALFRRREPRPVLALATSANHGG